MNKPANAIGIVIQISSGYKITTELEQKFRFGQEDSWETADKMVKFTVGETLIVRDGWKESILGQTRELGEFLITQELIEKIDEQSKQTRETVEFEGKYVITYEEECPEIKIDIRNSDGGHGYFECRNLTVYEASKLDPDGLFIEEAIKIYFYVGSSQYPGFKEYSRNYYFPEIIGKMKQVFI